MCYPATKNASAEISFVGRGIVCWLGFYPLFLLRRKRGPQLPRNFNCQLALQGKRISQGSIIALRPNLFVVARVDQLYVHDDAVGRAANASFQHMRNLQRLSNLAQFPRDGCAAVNHDRSAPNYFEVFDLAESGKDIEVLHSISEESIVLFRAHIFKRQNCDALLRKRS